MGLSLRNITKKISNVVEDHVIHPVATSPVAGAVKYGAATVTNNQKAKVNAKGALAHNLDQYKVAPALEKKNGKIAINNDALKASTAQLSNIAMGTVGTTPKVPVTAKVIAKVPAKTKVAFKPTDPRLTAVPVKKISGVYTALRSTSGVLGKIDPRLEQLVTQRREIGETGAAKAKSQLKVTNTLKKNEQTNLARVLKGTETPLNDRVVEAAKESRKVLNATYHQAKAAGVDVPGYKKNYFPQIHNPKTFQEGTSQSDAAIKHLVDSKQANSEAEAIGLMRQFKNVKSVSPYQNLTKHRALDLPGYAENVPALHQYLDRAHASIAHTKTMGKGDKNLNKVLADVKKNGGDYEQAIKSYRQASGLNKGSELGERLSRIATNVQGSTKLGLSSIGNATQSANTAIVGGVGRTAKNLVTQKSKANKAFVEKTGVTDEQVAHEALFGEQGVSKGLRKITAPFFEPVEKGNRATAALVGRDLANKLAKKAAGGDANAARRLEKEFGITGVTKKGLTEAQQISAARKMVERTQFRTGPQDLPGWASTPTGRVVSQFKRYPYKQTQFLKKEVIDPARKGNVAPALRLAGVGAPVALAANYASDKARGANFDQSAPEKALDIANTVTGANLVTSLAQSLYPNSYDANSYLVKTGKALGGPTISDTIKAVQAGFEATKGKYTNAERFGLQHIPVIGTPISNRVLPYKNSSTVAGGGDKAPSSSDQIKNAFGSEEGKAFLALSPADKIAAAQSDPDMAEIYKEWQGAKSALKSAKLLAPDISPEAAKILNRYNRATTQGKDKWFNKENDAEFKYAAAKYENDKLTGNLSDAEDIRAQNALAKKYVGSTYSKNTRDTYGLAKRDLEKYVTEHPSEAKALLAYDQDLFDSGLISSLKFKNGFSSKTASKGKSSGSSSPFSDPYSYTVTGKNSSFPSRKASVSLRALPKAKTASKTGKIKVTRKASKV